MDNSPIVVETTVDVPVLKVWTALTDKSEMKKWYFDVSGFDAKPGFEFSFAGQGSKGEQYMHLCKITEVIPEKRLQYSWRYDGYPGNSLVTFELTPEGNKTHVKLTHEGVESFANENPDFAKSSFVGGWNEIIPKMLKNYVEGHQH